MVMFCSLSPPSFVPYRNGCACALPSLTIRSPSPDSVPPCPGSDCPGGTGAGWSRCSPESVEAAITAAAPGREGREPELRKVHVGTSERKGNFLKEQVASVFTLYTLM